MSAPMIRVILFSVFLVLFCEPRILKEDDILLYRKKVIDMFHHAYDGYIKYAYPYDELRPLTCDGLDTWGSYSLTLIDALDMLVIMGNTTEFQRVAHLVIDKMDFDDDINVSVFETNIRVIGGLLSAHLMSKRGGLELEAGWPCSGPLLRMAEDVGRRLLPAFDTPTGMPYGTVNLMYGVPTGETTITCTAGVGTFLIEFGALSKLTGDPIFEKVAMRAMKALWKARSTIDLVGNHIDVATGKWTALDAGIGGGIDSYFEYLVKGSIMFQNTELLDMYNEYLVSIEKHLKRDDWYMWAHMTKGSISLPIFTSLDCYWPGIQAMLGHVDKAMKTMHNFHQVWKQFGFLPEFYNIVKNEAHAGREGYPLRPELVEAAMYLYQATKDPYLLEIGIDILESIEHNTKTRCGYATVKDVTTHTLENRMESFFLAETAKYLYLLFDPDNFIHNTGDHGTVIDTPNGQCVIDAGGYIFNTEAHPIDTGALYCCSAEKKEDDLELQDFHDNLDLLALFGITDNKDNVQGVKWNKGRHNDGQDNIMNQAMQFINIDKKKVSLHGNIGTEHQTILSTKGEKFTVNVKDTIVTKVTIAPTKVEVNNKNIDVNAKDSSIDNVVASDPNKGIGTGEQSVELDAERGEDSEVLTKYGAADKQNTGNLVEVCDKDGKCRRIGSDSSTKKYTEEDNRRDTETETVGSTRTGRDVSLINEDKESVIDINSGEKDTDSGDELVDGSIQEEQDKKSTKNFIELCDKEGACRKIGLDISMKKYTEEENRRDPDTETVVDTGVSEISEDRDQNIEAAVSKIDKPRIDNEDVSESSEIKIDSVTSDEETNRPDRVTVTARTLHTTQSRQTSKVKVGTEKLKDVLFLIKSFTEDYLSNKGLKSVKSLHDKLKYYSLFHRQKHEQLTCDAQPFHMRFSFVGEMFLTE